MLIQWGSGRKDRWRGQGWTGVALDISLSSLLSGRLVGKEKGRKGKRKKKGRKEKETSLSLCSCSARKEEPDLSNHSDW